MEAPVFAATFQETLRSAVDALRLPVGDNTVGQIGLAILFVIVAVLLRSLLLGFVFAKLTRWTSSTDSSIDDRLVSCIRGPAKAFILVLGIFSGLTVLTLPEEASVLVDRAFQGATLTLALWAILRSVDLLVELIGNMAVRRGMELEPFLPLIKRSLKLFITVIGVILVVQNLGYSVGSLLAGLGIGGLAVALAAQDSLANLFGSVTIAADLPFKVGDHIRCAGFEGTVELVGLRSTRIRTFENSIVQVPNKTVANEAIENFTRREKRRVTQVIGLVYSTSPAMLTGIVEELRGILAKDPDVVPDSALVHFSDFGASSLDIHLVYFTKSLDIRVHRETRQRLNLAFMDCVARQGSSFAFPTRTLHVESPVLVRTAGQNGPRD